MDDRTANRQMAHLHLHTDASIRDGLGPVSRMISRVKAMGFQSVAMTDHGTLANAISFSIEAKANGIKPIIGMEGYIALDGEIGHITLLANGNAGWHSLLELNNLAHASEFRQPAFTVDELVKHNDGLVCLTGCIASPFQRLSLKEAQLLGHKLKAAFGNRIFAELMFVGDSLGWDRPMRLASNLGLKTVITNDVHFPLKLDGTIHPILTRMKSGFSYDSENLYLKSFHELVDAATRMGISVEVAEESLRRTGRIADLIGGVDLAREPHLPHTHISKSLEEIVRFGPRADALFRSNYNARFKTELAIIKAMGYEDYFLILNDILWHAQENNVKIGPGRGSGAGSLILYLLGITDVDPIAHGLQFERFLNPERKGMPDVDVDLESERRDLVLDYAKEKYDAIPIATYSRYSHKSLVRDLGKMFRLDKDLIDQAADKGDSSPEFAGILEDYPEFEVAYEAIMGQVRHKGKHAGGVIITDTPVPVERISNNELAAAWTEGQRNELSYAGIVKFDLLGLSVLSALRRLEETYPHEIETISRDPSDHPEIFEEIFKKGRLSGIFQFAGSEGIRKLTMELQPETFEELVAINAVYRPGAIDAGATEKFPEWKKSPRPVPEYIEDILAPTFGAIVYQEQMMEIYRRTVGGTLGTADLARRYITKSKPGDPVWEKHIRDIHDAFVKGATRNWKLSPKEAEGLWDELATHSRYSFNKSHATAYTMIAWQCAYWKYHRPAAFYAAMLNTDKSNQQTYMIDAVMDGVKILPPHVNHSTTEWVSPAEGKTGLHMPLSAIKFLGDAGVEEIVEVRKGLPTGEFENLEQFMELVPKKLVRARAREGLIMLGGFKGLWEELVDSPEELHELLALKSGAIEFGMDKAARQQKYLGFIVPDKRFIDTMARYKKLGWTCGIIDSVDNRSGKFGPYAVYRISPNGVFWSRDIMDLEKGQPVAVKISDKNGKANSIKIL